MAEQLCIGCDQPVERIEDFREPTTDELEKHPYVKHLVEKLLVAKSHCPRCSVTTLSYFEIPGVGAGGVKA